MINIALCETYPLFSKAYKIMRRLFLAWISRPRPCTVIKTGANDLNYQSLPGVPYSSQVLEGKFKGQNMNLVDPPALIPKTPHNENSVGLIWVSIFQLFSHCKKYLFRIVIAISCTKLSWSYRQFRHQSRVAFQPYKFSRFWQKKNNNDKIWWKILKFKICTI